MPTKQGSYLWLKKLPKKQFKRLVGVTFKVYKLMVKVLEAHEAGKTAGGKSKLSPEDKVLMTLQYLREYPSLLRLAIDWAFTNQQPNASLPKLKNCCYKAKTFICQAEKPSRKVTGILSSLMWQKPRWNDLKKTTQVLFR